MSTFMNDFDPSKGDLLYGMAKSRSKYLDEYEQIYDNWLEKNNLLSVVDDYNTIFYDITNSPGKGAFSPQEIMHYVQAFKPLTILGNEHPHQRDVAEEYWKEIQAHKFSPISTAKEPLKCRRGGFTSQAVLPSNLGGDGVKTWEQEGYKIEALNRSFRAIRRACKFGVGFVADNLCRCRPEARIRFLLDRFRMPSCFDKEQIFPGGWLGNSEFPITYSELRYTFRNWSRFSGKVVFYMNYQSVSPPWEEDWILEDCFGDKQSALKDKWTEYGEYVQKKKVGTF